MAKETRYYSCNVSPQYNFYRRLTIPETYEEDDTPRRFKELLSPRPKPVREVRKEAKSAKSDVWTVRPGETFREFNARIREAGESVPPGIPTTFRAGARTPGVKRDEEPMPEPMPKPMLLKRTAEETPLEDERAKTRKQERLRQRRDQIKEKKERKREEKHEDAVWIERRGLRDVVRAPPALKVLPKATLKIKKSHHQDLSERPKAPISVEYR